MFKGSAKKSAPVQLWLIHGMFQSPAAWEPVLPLLHEEWSRISTIELKVEAVPISAKRVEGLRGWGERFVQRVEAHGTDSTNFVVGYSMGGRLAWHALLSRPEVWRGAVIISADPGPESEGDRELALRRDELWANRIQTESPDQVMADWDTQAVFAGYPNKAPRAQAMDLADLAEMLVIFSKGHQENLREEIAQLQVPMLYISGVDDEKYRLLGNELSNLARYVSHIDIANAGHRVPWDSMGAFVKTTTSFIRDTIR